MDAAEEGLWPEAFEPQQSGTAEELPAEPGLTADRSPRRPKSRAGRGARGKLARAVEDLRASEDRMVATLAASERTLRSLGEHHVYQAAGYASLDELQERMMRATPLLAALREPTLRLEAGVSVVTPDRTKAQTTRALSAISRALQRLRTLEERIRQEAWSARRALTAVERDYVYEECGYNSFEDFLERALGPSPLLANAVSLAGEEPPPVPPVTEADALRSSLMSAPDSAARPSRVDSVAAALLPDALSDTVAVVVPMSPVQQAPVEPVAEARPKTAGGRSRWALRASATFLLAVAASGVGAAVGHTPVQAAPAHERAEVPVPPSAAASSAASPPKVPAAKSAPADSAHDAAPPSVAPRVGYSGSDRSNPYISTATYTGESFVRTRAVGVGLPSKAAISNPRSSGAEAGGSVPEGAAGAAVERLVPSRGTR